MLRPVYDESWPEMWKSTYHYDELELWGSRRDIGYTYQYRVRHEWSIRSIENLVPAGGEVLDVAAAGGNFSLPLAEKGYRVTWNDLRAELTEAVKRKYEFGHVEYAPGNIFELAKQWADRFDAVLAAEIIEHVAHPDQFLACLGSVLKPGGRLFLTTPNGAYFLNRLPRFSDCPDPSVFESAQFGPGSEGHIFLLYCDECQALAGRAGLSVERIEVTTNPLTRGHFKLGHILPWLPESLVWGIERASRRLPVAPRDKLHCQILTVLRKPDQA